MEKPMKHFFTQCVLLFALINTAIATPAPPTLRVLPSAVWSTQQYKRFTVAWLAQYTYANPFQDVTMSVTFSGPNGETIETLAYWYDRAEFRARIAFPSVGEWTWRTTATPEDPGLHNKSGKIRVFAYQETNPLLGHGFLRVSDDGRSLVHADGTPFVWIGETVWTSTVTLSPEAFKTVIDDLAEKGFTVLQTNFARMKGDRRTDTEGNPIYGEQRWDVGFMKKLDTIFDYANDKGIYLFVNGLIDLAWDHEIRGYPDNAETKRLLAMLAARYFAHHISWSSSMDDSYSTEQDRLLGHMAAGDSEHLYMQHGGGDTPGCDQYIEISTNVCTAYKYYLQPYTHATMVEIGGSAYQTIKGIQYLQSLGGKPVIQGEAWYEGFDETTANDAVKMAMRSLLSGAAGHTHGTLLWDLQDSSVEAFKRYPGRFAMGAIHRVMTEFARGQAIVPNNALIANQVPLADKAYTAAQRLAYEHALLAGTTADQHVLFGYTPDGGDIALDVGDFGPAKIKWFNPLTGAETKPVSRNITGIQTFVSPFGALAQAMVILAKTIEDTWIDFQVSDVVVFADESFTLQWDSHASECNATGDWAGRKSGQGEEIISLSKNGAYLYTLQCGEKRATITVEVLIPGGPPANAAQFPYANSQINFDAPAHMLHHGNEITVSGWVKLHDYRSRYLVSQFGHNHAGWTIYQLYENVSPPYPPTRLCVAILGLDKDGEQVRFPYLCTRRALQKETPYHFAFTFRSSHDGYGTVGICLNGECNSLFMSKILTLDHIRPGATSDDPLTIGNNSPGGWGGNTGLNADLQELRIYDRAKSQLEIREDYNAGLGVYGDPNEPNLVAGYHLDEQDGVAVVQDYSGNGLDGTIPINTASHIPTVRFVPGMVSAGDNVIPPAIAFSAFPETITIGETSVLTWDAPLALQCEAHGAWEGILAPSGEQEVSPGATATYTIACTNSGGTREKSVTISVTTPPPNGLNIIPFGDLSKEWRHGGFSGTNPEWVYDGNLLRVTGAPGKQLYGWMSSEKFPIIASKPYNISFEVSAAGTDSVSYNVFYYDKTGKEIGWNGGAITVRGNQSAPAVFHGDITSKAGATSAMVQIRIQSASGGTATIDNIIMKE